MKRLLIGVIILAFGTAIIVSSWRTISKITESELKQRIVKLEIPKGTTFAQFMSSLGMATDTVLAILESSKNTYNLSRIVEGRELALFYNATSSILEKLVYEIDSESEFIAEPIEDVWQSSTSSIAYEVREKTAAGVIETSLYETIVGQGQDERLALALAETFAWQIDFAADIQKGDSFKVFYEERWREGQYVMPGKILAAEFSNTGKTFRGYYFEDQGTKAGYYDENGNSLQKQFLKSPLQYKYISSGYSYARLNPITKKIAAHRGIDYAANYGTPAVSVGDGMVIQAGWNGPYGISVLVRHNETYTTRYGHFQSLARGIRVGVKVKQGQVVGYVGATGEATGPHLHYEMHKFGSHVNPFKVEVPPGDPVAEEDRAALAAIVEKYQLILEE
jgi:murein DD-endopeptidase MepM/ murein hydrolase activator NlpD